MASYCRLQSYYKHNKSMATAMSSSNIKRYMNSKGGKEFMGERAPSTADVMKIMEEEKDRQSQKQGRSKDEVPTTATATTTPDSGVKSSYEQGDDTRRQTAGDT